MTDQLISSVDGKKWFSEINSQWPGQCFSLEIEEMLLDVKSEYQHVQVFRSATFGNVLCLDGVIQITEKDEMAYQEMITHIPMFAHPSPQSVLIVGGGDGGVIREVVKHKSVTRIVICEIDKVVIEAGKKYFPTVATAWDDPRVELVCADASKYVAEEKQHNSFDVIVSDTSDPVGPAATLFEMPFYSNLKQCLRPGGRVSTQAESFWIHLELIEQLVSGAKNYFTNVEYAATQIPSYPCGMIGFLVCTKEDESPPQASSICCRPADVDGMDLKFYTADYHNKAFVLPKFVQDKLRPFVDGKQV